VYPLHAVVDEVNRNLGEEVKGLYCASSRMDVRSGEYCFFECVRDWLSKIGKIESIAGHIFLLACDLIRTQVYSAGVNMAAPSSALH
jgi:hypothetical protein